MARQLEILKNLSVLNFGREVFIKNNYQNGFIYIKIGQGRMAVHQQARKYESNRITTVTKTIWHWSLKFSVL